MNNYVLYSFLNALTFHLFQAQVIEMSCIFATVKVNSMREIRFFSSLSVLLQRRCRDMSCRSSDICSHSKGSCESYFRASSSDITKH